MKVTIREVAKASGKSISTVSRVLTGSDRVSEEARQAVNKAIEELGYRPNQTARGLKTTSTKTVGLLLNDITNPFYSSIAKGAEEVAKERGYTMMFSNVNEDADIELINLKMMHDRSVDGIIFGPTGGNLDFIKYLNRIIPIVQIDRKLEDLDAPAVIVDNEKAAYQATKTLIDLEHQNIGIIQWKAGVHTPKDRMQGYLRALKEAGIQPDPENMVKAKEFAPRKTSDLARRLIEKEDRPSAIFALNNQLGIGAFRAIREAGLRIPEDVALIVFDDLETFALTTPTISAVSQPAFSIGKKAMKLLLGRIEDGQEDEVSETVVLPTHFVQRQST